MDDRSSVQKLITDLLATISGLKPARIEKLINLEKGVRGDPEGIGALGNLTQNVYKLRVFIDSISRNRYLNVPDGVRGDVGRIVSECFEKLSLLAYYDRPKRDLRHALASHMRALFSMVNQLAGEVHRGGEITDDFMKNCLLVPEDLISSINYMRALMSSPELAVPWVKFMERQEVDYETRAAESPDE